MKRKNEIGFIPKKNLKCLVDYGFKNTTTTLLKGYYYTTYNFSSYKDITSFEFWDEDGFIGRYIINTSDFKHNVKFRNYNRKGYL